MTRVSDTAAFAEAVADGGGLPFLALALLRGPEVRALLDEAAARLGGPALGRRHPRLRPARAAPRAARGDPRGAAPVRPDRRRPARPGRASSKREGIATYLHVPSPGLLGQFLKRRRAAVRARRARVRRARRAAVELRALGAGGRGRPARRSIAGVAAGEVHLALRRRHPRRPLRGRWSPRWPAPLAERGVQGRRPGRHRLPVHRARPSRPARSSPRFQAGGRPLRRDGAAGDRARARGPRQPDAVRRRLRARSGGGCSPRAGRPRRSARRWRG